MPWARPPAMVLGMRKAGIEAEVLLLSHLPRKYAFMFHDNGIVHHDAEKGWPAALRLDEFDALLVVDTGTWSQLPGLKEKVERIGACRSWSLDHHLTQEDWADAKLVVTEAAAAGEIAAELLDLAACRSTRRSRRPCSWRSPATRAGSSFPTPAPTRCAWPPG